MTCNSSIQLTGDIHEEVKDHNHLLDRMVCSLNFLHFDSAELSEKLSLLDFILKSGKQYGHIEGYNVRNHGPIQNGM